MTTSDDPPVTRRDSPTEFAGDAYWLKRGVAIIEGTQESLTRAAERLAMANVWFWTTYLAVLALRTHGARTPSIVEVVPAGLIILSYVASASAQMPAAGSFDPRSPESVMAAHTAAARSRTLRLRWAHILTLVGGVSVAVALLWG